MFRKTVFDINLQRSVKIGKKHILRLFYYGKLLSCKFNIDTGNVKCRFADGAMASIECDAVEDTGGGTLFLLKVRTELDCLIYNALREYVQLVLNGGLEAYLRQAHDEHIMPD